MAESNELKKIKKIYGEKLMKLCRELFPTILENEGVLLNILESSFSSNCQNLYEDIYEGCLEEDFKNYIFTKFNLNRESEVSTNQTPYELLDKAGYNLYECKTEEEIQKFKKYYTEDELICTIYNGGRLNSCIVFFAVKKNVEEIKRENFKIPRREDEYGTSVMGIQFNKDGICTVSIKNRYNHTVNNPDATYGNDLDRIIPGLKHSFRELLRESGLDLNNSNIEKLAIPGYVVANDGKYYKYNMEINGRYYCPGNIIIKDMEVIELENPESCLLIDYFVLNMKDKTINLYDSNIVDSFCDDLVNIEKIELTKNKEIRF